MNFEPLNMHTDLKVTAHAAGVRLHGTDKHQQSHVVIITKPTADAVGASPQNMHTDLNMHTDVNMHTDGQPAGGGAPSITPFNMHTDHVVSSDDDEVVIAGMATHGDKTGQLRLTVNGPARKALKGSPAGL